MSQTSRTAVTHFMEHGRWTFLDHRRKAPHMSPLRPLHICNSSSEGIAVWRLRVSDLGSGRGTMPGGLSGNVAGDACVGTKNPCITNFNHSLDPTHHATVLKHPSEPDRIQIFNFQSSKKLRQKRNRFRLLGKRWGEGRFYAVFKDISVLHDS